MTVFKERLLEATIVQYGKQSLEANIMHAYQSIRFGCPHRDIMLVELQMARYEEAFGPKHRSLTLFLAELIGLHLERAVKLEMSPGTPSRIDGERAEELAKRAMKLHEDYRNGLTHEKERQLRSDS